MNNPTKKSLVDWGEGYLLARSKEQRGYLLSGSLGGGKAATVRRVLGPILQGILEALSVTRTDAHESRRMRANP